MIRINLLGRPRPRVKRRVAIAGRLQLVLFAIPVGLAIAVLFVHYVWIQRDIETLQQQIQQKEAEQRQMAELQREIEEFEQKQRIQAGRIAVIEQLRRNQSGPVQLLASVGDTVSVTDTVWLESLTEQQDGKIEFKGFAGSVNAVADLITNLNQSGFFKNIEMKETVQESPREGTSNFTFTLTAEFLLPKPPEAAEAPPATTATGAN